MRQLNINITKATLKSYTVELEEGKPVVSATINLLTEGGMEVTTYTVSTQSWYSDKNKFELPIEAIVPIVKLAKILENATVTKCRDSQMALTSGLPTDPIVAADLEALALPETVEREVVDDEEIDLSEIPF